MSRPVVGFAGMTHLGLVSAVAAAAGGFEVVALGEPDVVAAVARGELPVLEPGLPELLAANRDRLTFTAQAHDLSRCDLVYVAVDVPTDGAGASDLAPIRATLDTIAPHLDPRAVLVVLSQVPPGFTRGVLRAPERLFYQVETLVFGNAVERATKPERFIVGCADPQAPLPPSLGAFLQSFGCPILSMRYESAELAKISINCCLVASVSVANTLAELSEALGADWAEIVPALKLDRRIGEFAYLNAGLGIAGGNLERDLRTVIELAQGHHADAGVVKAWLANSTHRKDWVWRALSEEGFADCTDAKIAVLGLAYKENTHSTKNSPALVLLDHLRGRKVTVHDPAVPASVVPWATGAADPHDAARGADVLVIATPWPQYRNLRASDLAAAMTGRTIIDPYRVLDAGACAAAGFTYRTLGMPALKPAA
jgi:UDPglucose 6-dehydrogenase